jgi:hypothetical protein
MEQTVYARVYDGKIIEYPVYEIHIRNRVHPFDWYKKVEKSERPASTVYQYVKETLTVNNDRVMSNYHVVDHGLDYLFSMIYSSNDYSQKPVSNKDIPINQIEDQFISAAPEGYMEALTTAVDRYVSNLLNEFAATSGFDSINSLVSYKDSTVAEWASMANEFIILRDLMWTTCINMQKELRAGTKSIPKSLLEFTELLPELKYTKESN